MVFFFFTTIFTGTQTLRNIIIIIFPYINIIKTQSFSNPVLYFIFRTRISNFKKYFLSERIPRLFEEYLL